MSGNKVMRYKFAFDANVMLNLSIITVMSQGSFIPNKKWELKK